MKQEDKELLLKDISARLPYGVKVKNIEENTMGEVFAINRNKRTNNHVVSYYLSDDCDTLSCTQIEFVKPYLRPMKSMTGEEIRATNKMTMMQIFDYYNSIHVDYRGLIPRCLAIKAPEDMYK